MTLTHKHAQVEALLARVVEPKLRWSLTALNLIKRLDISADGRSIALDINLISDDKHAIAALHATLENELNALGFSHITVTLGRVNVASQGIQGVKHIILVAAGKGGVGKSSVALNLALALAATPAQVGLMDADIYGPSLPIMLGLQQRPEVLPDNGLQPLEKYGLKTMSLGYLLDEEQAVDWRGQLACGTVLQFIHNTLWGALDYLIVDLPPGTGDIALSLAHRLKSSGVLMVSTPQQVVLGDVRRALNFFAQRDIPLLGLVENMSFFECPHCHHSSQPLGQERLAHTDRELPLLARLPLSADLTQAHDCGCPLLISAPEHPISQRFMQLAHALRQQLGEHSAAAIPA